MASAFPVAIRLEDFECAADFYRTSRIFERRADSLAAGYTTIGSDSAPVDKIYLKILKIIISTIAGDNLIGINVVRFQDRKLLFNGII